MPTGGSACLDTRKVGRHRQRRPRPRGAGSWCRGRSDGRDWPRDDPSRLLPDPRHEAVGGIRGGRGGLSAARASTKVRAATHARQRQRLRPPSGARVLRGPCIALEAAWSDAHTHIGHNDPDGRKATPGDPGRARRGPPAPRSSSPCTSPTATARPTTASSRPPPPPASRRLQGTRASAPTTPTRWRRRGAACGRGRSASSSTRARTPSGSRTPSSNRSSRASPASSTTRCSSTPGAASRTSARPWPDLAHRYPGARLILAHAGISDLGWIADEAAELPNLLFDTAWWNIPDQLARLLASVTPRQKIYASDMPYGPGVLSTFVFLRTARAVGLARKRPRARSRAASSPASSPATSCSTSGLRLGLDGMGRASSRPSG